MSRIISFRGLMAEDTQERISLSTNQGLIGYKITKMQLIPKEPGGLSAEHIVQIFKEQQTTNASQIDFSENRLLAAGYCSNHTGGDAYPTKQTIVFDNEIFNQDIFITHKIRNGTGSVNYYIELEQMDLALDEATVATLKDIRNVA